MSELVVIENHGPLIISTNYWETELALHGKLYISVNAGAIRILLPPAQYHTLDEMRTAKTCVLSRGPWPLDRDSSRGSLLPKPVVIENSVEILFDDGTDAPFALHLTPESFDLLPAEPAAGREWVLTVWTAKDGQPHRALERVCHWRRVERLPWLKPWGSK